MAVLKKLWEYMRNTQLWNSIFRHGPPDTARNRGLVILTNVFLHLHPVKVRKSGIRLRFTWCMGGITFFLFLVEVATGLLLMFYYHPTVEYAYVDIVDLREQVPLGVMRELHRWGAHAMVITVWLHMLRVFMTGSYKPPREFNWNVGVFLLVLTLLLSFTGYLLPWDQLAMWAVTVGSNMARATPLLGHEGPGSSLLKIGDISLVNAGNDARRLDQERRQLALGAAPVLRRHGRRLSGPSLPRRSRPRVAAPPHAPAPEGLPADHGRAHVRGSRRAVPGRLLRSEFRADRSQAGQRADRGNDIPGRLLRLVRAQGRTAQR